MIPLKAVGVPQGLPETIVGRICSEAYARDRLVVADPMTLSGQRLVNTQVLLSEKPIDAMADTVDTPRITEIGCLGHLESGDVVALHPSGRIDTLYRLASPNNSLFATDRCNSKCLMCSQPPRLVDDIDYFFALNKVLLEFLPDTLPTLGMTGGEPTLLGDRLGDLLRVVAQRLPRTQFEILSNGRAFSRAAFARSVASASTDQVLFSVPLYSDYGPQHDFVVQAKDAFAQTVVGLHNLARFNVRAEIRVVLHRQTVDRLPQLAQFIQKNLTFIEHVAFMGMEHTGYARLHDDLLWIDAPEYAAKLERAVVELSDFGYRVSLYNLQPCLVPRALWSYIRISISDWKREYLPACAGCTLRDRCGGVFGTSRRHSPQIRAISQVS